MSNQVILSKIISENRPHLSFEFFPPKADEGLPKLYDVIAKFKALQPDYCSVTWGAGGNTVKNSLKVVNHVANEIGLTTILHFTGLGMTKATVDELLAEIKSINICNLLVLRGDIPHNMKRDDAFQGGFRYAGELVKYIRSQPGCSRDELGILVAGCPEGHPEAVSKEKDWDYLMDKVSFGADGIVTQLFFDNDAFVQFMSELESRKNNAPIAAGIMIITKARMIKRMIELSNCAIPPKVSEAISKYESDDNAMESFGIDYATKQVDFLWEKGIRNFHFYTMNRYEPTNAVIQNLSHIFRQSIGH